MQKATAAQRAYQTGSVAFGRLKSNRLFRGSAVGLAGMVAFAAVQLVSVPLLSAAFGIRNYGLWLLLWTVPSYFTLSDLGLMTAASNDIASRWAGGHRMEAQRTYRSVGLIIHAVAMTISALVVAALVFSPANLWSAEFLANRDTLLLLVGWAALTLAASVPNTAMRASGRFVEASLSWDIGSMVEQLLMLVVAFRTRDMEKTALTLLVVRATILPVQHYLLHRFSPELSLGPGNVSMNEVRRLIGPALGVMGIPVAMALNLQGLLLVVGAFLGPIAVAMIGPTRSLVRIAIQVIGVMNRATIPEIAAAHGRGDVVAQRRLWLINRRLTALALGMTALVYAAIGVPVIAQWTGGRIVPPFLLVLLFAVDIIPHGWWYFSLWLLTATQDHARRSPVVVAAMALGIVLALAATPIFGLTGTVTGILIGDGLLAFYMERAVRHRLRAITGYGNGVAPA